MERKNLGNYEHKEVTAEAVLDEGENTLAAIVNLKFFVQDALHGSVYKEEDIKKNFTVETKEVKKEEHVPQPPVEGIVNDGRENTKCDESSVVDGGNSEETQAKEKSTSDKKTKKSTKKSISEYKIVSYDRNIDAHRQFLSSYLTQTHPEWKTTEGVKEFSLSLIGKPFLDDSGHIVESFKKVLSDFFS